MPSINISPAKLKGLAPMVLPIVALYVLKITTAPAPTFAGLQAEEASETTAVRLVQPAMESQRCAEWAKELQGTPVGASPFFYPDVEEVAVDPIPVSVEEAPALKPTATLEGVMGSGTRVMALINGNLLSVGDAVDGDWTIGSIDVERRTVELVHPEGRTFRLETER
jgi:hypothetical protein